MASIFRGDGTDFSRALAYHRAVTQAFAQKMVQSVDEFIAKYGGYESRGHGGKHRPNRSRPYMGGSRSKHNPHQGKQECARRLRTTLVSKPRGMWFAEEYDLESLAIFMHHTREGATRLAKRHGCTRTPRLAAVNNG